MKRSIKAKFMSFVGGVVGLGLVIVVISVVYMFASKSATWERITTIGEEKAVLVNQFNIPASGWNLRAYEFELPNSPGVHCVFVAGENKGGLDCFEASTPTE